MSGPSSRNSAVDSSYGASVVMNEIHALTHTGDVYVASEVVTITSAAPSRYILIDCTLHSAHLSFSWAASGDASIVLYGEVPNVTGGTDLTCINKNRYSTKTCDVAITHTPTVTDAGTTDLLNSFIPGGNKKGSGGSGGFEEYIFKKGNKYLLHITNAAGTDITFNTILTWYEVP